MNPTNASNLSDSSDFTSQTCFYLDRFQIFHSGPPTTEYIVNCTLNAALAVVAIFGNGLVFQALRKSAALRPPSRALMYSLAASDFFVGLLVQPFYVLYKTAEIMNYHQLYCITGIGFHLSANIFSAVSFLTVTAIAIDRLLALHLGSRYQTTVTLKRVTIAILTIWALTGLWIFNWVWDIETYQIFNISVVIVCLLFCTGAYVRLGYRLCRPRVSGMARWQDGEPSQGEAGRRSSSGPRFGAYKRSVANMFYVYILMLVCYVPYLSMFFVIQTRVTKAKILALSYSMTLLFANSAFNPFLYCWRIKEIREEVLLILAKFACKSD